MMERRREQVRRTNHSHNALEYAKRYLPDSFNDALKEGKFELRLLFHTKRVGAIIGRGGEIINGIRDKYDAVLSVPDKNTPERVLTLTCRQEVLMDCVKDLLFRMFDEKYGKEIEVRMLIHQSQVGAILGHGGRNIKEITKNTSSTMRMFSEFCPDSTERILLITADRDKIVDAMKSVLDILFELPIKGIQKPYNSINYHPVLFEFYGGFEPDTRYGRASFAGTPSDFRSPVPEFPERDMYGRGGGPMLRSRGAPQLVPPASPPYSPNYADKRDPFSNRIRPLPLGGTFYDGIISTQITIPNLLGGTIIGKGGERISRIRSETGARIELGEAFSENERFISISGTPQQIQHVQVLLQQCVRSTEAGRRYLKEAL